MDARKLKSPNDIYQFSLLALSEFTTTTNRFSHTKSIDVELQKKSYVQLLNSFINKEPNNDNIYSLTSEQMFLKIYDFYRDNENTYFGKFIGLALMYITNIPVSDKNLADKKFIQYTKNNIMKLAEEIQNQHPRMIELDGFDTLSPANKKS